MISFRIQAYFLSNTINLRLVKKLRTVKKQILLQFRPFFFESKYLQISTEVYFKVLMKGKAVYNVDMRIIYK